MDDLSLSFKTLAMRLGFRNSSSAPEPQWPASHPAVAADQHRRAARPQRPGRHVPLQRSTGDRSRRSTNISSHGAECPVGIAIVAHNAVLVRSRDRYGSLLGDYRDRFSRLTLPMSAWVKNSPWSRHCGARHLTVFDALYIRPRDHPRSVWASVPAEVVEPRTRRDGH